VLMLAGIDDLKLDSTTSHPSSSSHRLPHHIDCHLVHPVPTITGCMVLRLQCTYCRYPVIHCLAVGFGFGYGYGRKRVISFGRGFGYGHNWTAVTAPLSATAENRKTGFGRSLDICLGKPV